MRALWIPMKTSASLSIDKVQRNAISSEARRTGFAIETGDHNGQGSATERSRTEEAEGGKAEAVGNLIPFGQEEQVREVAGLPLARIYGSLLSPGSWFGHWSARGSFHSISDTGVAES
jgi:hypothetical protein